jgi:hypothetical protein
MKLMKKLIYLTFFSSALILTACGDDDDNASACGANYNFQVELAAEAQILTDAAVLYANDPTTANCNAYVAAFNAYLDAAEDLEDCAILSGQQVEFNQAIDDARASLDALQC